jgi:hypothetical protein
MAIMSSYRPDNSSARYKRFAQMAYTCAIEPKSTKKYDNQIPLESLFRLLEMYRYNAFKDDAHSGVLALRSASEIRHHPVANAWHLSIKQALDETFNEVFEGKSKDEAVRELETILYLMSNRKQLTAEQKDQAADFFRLFSEALL